jgi:hypothetical protein
MSNHQNSSPLLSLNPNEAATSAASSVYSSNATPTKASHHKPVPREVTVIIYLYA